MSQRTGSRNIRDVCRAIAEVLAPSDKTFMRDICQEDEMVFSSQHLLHHQTRPIMKDEHLYLKDSQLISHVKWQTLRNTYLQMCPVHVLKSTAEEFDKLINEELELVEREWIDADGGVTVRGVTVSFKQTLRHMLRHYNVTDGRVVVKLTMDGAKVGGRPLVNICFQLLNVDGVSAQSAYCVFPLAMLRQEGRMPPCTGTVPGKSDS